MDKEHEVRLRQNIEELLRSRLSVLEQDISRLQREWATLAFDDKDLVLGLDVGAGIACGGAVATVAG